MTNVLPPQAKKQIVVEYWIRMASSWVVVWSVCLLISACLLWPTYVLLTGTTAAYQQSAGQATERSDEYNMLGRQLAAATKQAEQIVLLSKQQKITAITADVWRVVADHAVAVTSISLQKSEGSLVSFRVEGVATDRLALAGFRSSLQELPYVAEVELPLSDLADNQDIKFGLQITVMSDTP